MVDAKDESLKACLLTEHKILTFAIRGWKIKVLFSLGCESRFLCSRHRLRSASLPITLCFFSGEGVSYSRPAKTISLARQGLEWRLWRTMSWNGRAATDAMQLAIFCSQFSKK